MIAVLTKPADHPVVREFFELFKTPWTFHGTGVACDVLVCNEPSVPDTSAKLVLLFGAHEVAFDQQASRPAGKPVQDAVLEFGDDQIPVFGQCLVFQSEGPAALREALTRQPAALSFPSASRTVVRLGYDLFEEVRQLLTRGQPIEHARKPTLELHILVLRDLILRHGIPLLEIPPLPDGYPLTVCLTHDVDHVGVRNHKFDHTLFGFLYRATVGSAIDTLRSRKSARQLATNLRAALSLPLVHLGWAKDFWFQFDHYLELEAGKTSTFFVIPRKGDPGKGGPPKRAASYQLSEIVDDLSRVRAAGSEVGVHGIDAWQDSTRGREELAAVSRLTNGSELGVRMHWLYFNQESPVTLEEAGFSYDSTVGFNQTVGYRAGTTQVFKPLATQRLLELPLHIMDTSMFYPVHMNLSPEAAQRAVRSLIENAVRFGGVLTVNWHDRSIAPERLWDQTYVRLMQDCQQLGAWFPTASQAVAWFRRRRATTFERVTWEAGAVRVKLRLDDPDGLPALRLRVHRATHSGSSDAAPCGFVEKTVDRTGELRIELNN